MAKRIEWSPLDIAASEVLALYLKGTGMTYLQMQAAAHDFMLSTRFFDIVKQRRGPVRLSEFFWICGVCGVDPTKALVEISRRTAELTDGNRQAGERDREYARQVFSDRSARETETPSTIIDFDTVADEEARRRRAIEKVRQGDMGLAADRDPNKEVEAQGGDGR